MLNTNQCLPKAREEEQCLPKAREEEEEQQQAGKKQ